MLTRFALASGVFAALALFAVPVPAQQASPAQRPGLDVIYVPTPYDVVKRMLELAEVGPNDIHYDLGSGDGRIAIAAVRDFKAKKAVGIDLDPERIRESEENLAKEKLGGRVTFKRANIFETDFTEATVISMYLLDSINLRLRPKLLAMKPGTRIVTQSFDMGSWKPDHKEEIGFRNVFLFIVPAPVAGSWELTDGSRKISLQLTQEFQEFGGGATIDGEKADLAGGKLKGTKIEFTLNFGGKAEKFEGTVDGQTITGLSPSKWTARKTS